jgi:hypothetical protein
MWGVTLFGDELAGDFCDGFEAISIGDFGLFYRLAGKIVSRILGLLQQYRPSRPPHKMFAFGEGADARLL